MASPAQLAANRANAQKSTGPRSAEGKSVSRLNALRHTLDAKDLILPGEDPAAYRSLAEDYYQEFQPASPSELFHVETMLRADWQKRRLQRVESDLFRTLLSEAEGESLAAAFLSASPAAKLLARIQRQIAAFERTWNRARTELLRQRRNAGDAEKPLPAPARSKPAAPKLASFPQSASPGLTHAPNPVEEKPRESTISRK